MANPGRVDYDIAWVTDNQPSGLAWELGRRHLLPIIQQKRLSFNVLGICAIIFDPLNNREVRLSDPAVLPTTLWLSRKAQTSKSVTKVLEGYNVQLGETFNDVQRLPPQFVAFLSKLWQPSSTYEYVGVVKRTEDILEIAVNHTPRYATSQASTANVLYCHEQLKEEGCDACDTICRITDTELALIYYFWQLLNGPEDEELSRSISTLSEAAYLDMALFSRIDVCDVCTLHLTRAAFTNLLKLPYNSIKIRAVSVVRGLKQGDGEDNSTFQSLYQLYGPGTPKKMQVKQLGWIVTAP